VRCEMLRRVWWCLKLADVYVWTDASRLMAVSLHRLSTLFIWCILVRGAPVHVLAKPRGLDFAACKSR
jgi:hypothetical protein